jgi:hypothetical protein
MTITNDSATEFPRDGFPVRLWDGEVDGWTRKIRPWARTADEARAMAEAEGHTVVEVLDTQEGWTVVVDDA